MQQGWNNVLVFWEIWVLFLSNFERLTYSFVEVWGIVGQDARQILRYLHTFFVVVDFREKYILFCRILGECQPRCYFGGIYVLFVVIQRFIDLHTFKNWREGQCRKVHSRLELVGVHSVKTVYRRRSMGGKPIAQDCSITPLQK